MNSSKAYSLIPFFIFIFVFLGAGIYYDDFYKLPSPIAVSIGIGVAFIMYRGPLYKKIVQFVEGCGDSKIMTMCVIYLLAGAFATITKAIGGVDVMVHLGLSFIPVQYLLLGVFVISCFLSFSIGTSVGTIVALGPIVVGLADQSGINLGLVCGSLLGGAMFGDNLSLISDTTIAATQTVGCEMKDKFKANFFLAIPAALICCLVLYFISINITVDSVSVGLEATNINWFLVIPYVLVVVLAMFGIHVFVVLPISTIVAGILGAVFNSMDFISFSGLVYEGFGSMTEIFLLSMFTGGLARMVEKQGGIQFILDKMQSIIRSPKSAEFGIGLLVSSVAVAVANNTVAILISGDIAKNIAEKYNISKPKAASILDIFSCISQGLLPYGAQILILLSFTNGRLDYFGLIKSSYYFYILFVITVLVIMFPKNKKEIVEA